MARHQLILLTVLLLAWVSLEVAEACRCSNCGPPMCAGTCSTSDCTGCCKCCVYFESRVGKRGYSTYSKSWSAPLTLQGSDSALSESGLSESGLSVAPSAIRSVMTDANFGGDSGNSKLPRVAGQLTDYSPIQDFGYIDDGNAIGQEKTMFGDQSSSLRDQSGKFTGQSGKFADQSHKFGDQSQQFEEDGDAFSPAQLKKNRKPLPAKDDAQFNSYLRRLINEWRLTK